MSWALCFGLGLLIARWVLLMLFDKLTNVESFAAPIVIVWTVSKVKNIKTCSRVSYKVKWRVFTGLNFGYKSIFMSKVLY
jgi:hypothetical protein